MHPENTPATYELGHDTALRALIPLNVLQQMVGTTKDILSNLTIATAAGVDQQSV